MNRSLPLCLPMLLTAAALATASNTASANDEPLSLAADGLSLRYSSLAAPPEASVNSSTASDANPTAVEARNESGHGRPDLAALIGKPGHRLLPGLGSGLAKSGLSFDLGPQLRGLGNPGKPVVPDLSLALGEHEAYALIGFAGYRGKRGWAVGPEAWVNTNPGYRIRGLGIGVHDLRAGPLSIDLRLGATRQQNQGRSINGGVELRWHKP